MYGLQTGLVASMSREVSSVRISTKYGAHNYHNYRVGARGVLHYPQWWSSKRSPKNRHWESLEEGIKLTTWGKVSKKRSELLSVCIWTKLSPNFFLPPPPSFRLISQPESLSVDSGLLCGPVGRYNHSMPIVPVQWPLPDFRRIQLVGANQNFRSLVVV